MSSSEHAAFYLAKYLAKDSTQGILDYTPKRTKCGRAWGFTRKGLIPLHEEVLIENIPPKQFEEVLAIARAAWNDPIAYENSDFTFLGSCAETIIPVLFSVFC